MAVAASACSSGCGGTGSGCPEGQKVCGNGCIPATGVCCEQPGASASSYCNNAAGGVTEGNCLPASTCPAGIGPDTPRFCCSQDGTFESNDCASGEHHCGLLCYPLSHACVAAGTTDVSETDATDAAGGESWSLLLTGSYAPYLCSEGLFHFEGSAKIYLDSSLAEALQGGSTNGTGSFDGEETVATPCACPGACIYEARPGSVSAVKVAVQANVNKTMTLKSSIDEPLILSQVIGVSTGDDCGSPSNLLTLELTAQSAGEFSGSWHASGSGTTAKGTFTLTR
jgi:hypothetical protein